MRIGPHALLNAVFVAPMAGVTDRPFRQLYRRFGADYVVAEMVAARPDLRDTPKSRLRANHAGEPQPVAVQLLGADAAAMAESAA